MNTVVVHGKIHAVPLLRRDDGAFAAKRWQALELTHERRRESHDQRKCENAPLSWRSTGNEPYKL